MKNNGVKLFVIGLLIAACSLEIDSPWSYGFHVIEEGGIWENGKVILLEYLLGTHVRIDIFFDPLGYLLMFLGAGMLQPKGKFLNNAKVFSMVAAFAYLGKIGLPLVLAQEDVLLWVVACVVIQVVAMLICMYSFMLACKKQVDSYKYMEVGKDLTFAVELYGFAAAFGFLAGILVVCQFFFAKIIYVVLAVFEVFAVIYYAWKVLSYTKKLNLFDTRG